MKKVMILGAGLMQKPAILAAKNLGYKTVVVDGNANAVSVPLADEFYPVDLKNRDALAELSDKINSDGSLAGVFTAGTDFSANVAYIAEHCGLPGHKYEACLNASDKVRMRSCFKESGVPSPSFMQIDSSNLGLVEKKIENGEIEFPKVAKPVDNMGGRGCRLVRSKKEFETSVSSAVKNSRSGRAIFEDYMEGAEFSIDSIVYDGTLTITGFADRHIYYPPYFIEMGHSMPSSVSQKIKNELIATFALGIKSLGLTCGVAKADIKYTKNGPMIGEIAARLSGGYMSGWTFPYSSDFDLTEQALSISLGLKPEKLLQNRRPILWQPHKSVEKHEMPFELYEIPSVKFSAERAWLSIPGKVMKIYGIDEAKAIPEIKDFLPRIHEGDEVSFPRNNVEKCGNVISLAETRTSAYASAEKAVSCLTLRLEPDNPDTKKFLSGVCDPDEEGFPASAFTFAPQNGNSIEVGAGIKIKENASVMDFVPETLVPLMDSLEDWNHCTLRKTLEKFDTICPEHPEIDGKEFWTAVLRGGIQGALYIVDSKK